jgi:exodeoxyribonuclease VII small subunit
MPKKEDKNSFEYNFEMIKKIIEEFESGIENMSLENVMTKYQDGLKYLSMCKTKLKEAELKIEKINSEFSNNQNHI